MYIARIPGLAEILICVRKIREKIGYVTRKEWAESKETGRAPTCARYLSKWEPR